MLHTKVLPHRSGIRAGFGALLLISLSSCASTMEPIEPCCYKGEFELAHVRDLNLALSDGDMVSFSQAFPGYQPQSGIFTTAFPFNKVAISQVTYGALRPVLPQYDSNGNGHLQEPELTVLYIREAALGLGMNVDHVATVKRADALVLSAGETGGLVRYVNDNLHRMTPEAQRIFKELKMVGLDLRNKGSENNGLEMRSIIVP
jgi:hypothetical protein